MCMKERKKENTFLNHLKVDIVSLRKSAQPNKIVFPRLSIPTNIVQGMS